MSRAEKLEAFLRSAKLLVPYFHRGVKTIPECCEFGHCRVLLGVPYGRLDDLSIGIRRMILAYMLSELQVIDGTHVSICDWCFGLNHMDNVCAFDAAMPCCRCE